MVFGHDVESALKDGTIHPSHVFEQPETDFDKDEDNQYGVKLRMENNSKKTRNVKNNAKKSQDELASLGVRYFARSNSHDRRPRMTIAAIDARRHRQLRYTNRSLVDVEQSNLDASRSLLNPATESYFVVVVVVVVCRNNASYDVWRSEQLVPSSRTSEVVEVWSMSRTGWVGTRVVSVGIVVAS
ncbi:hypothetical protein CLCR_09144 [Cladophialophora carrionii]|uniref:Uncharacterized protein n=1 Tax=Cladophialophora carrionii TaxID=86049 RepID=A0A1C1CUL9_9EURO|nr:hypothetical protein CLCR_09144 [Cladophialophora carrionii]